MISQMYHEMMERNRKLFLIVLSDNELAEIREKAQKHPRKLLELLTNYFIRSSVDLFVRALEVTL